MTLPMTWRGPADPGFAREVASYPGAEKVLSCMQCGVCSGSCPMAAHMSEPPRRVMAHILVGERERALGSDAIWYCASCFACAVRCPQSISVTDVMYALRSMAMPRVKGVSPVFYQAFTASVIEGGRAHEAGVAIKAGLARGMGDMLGLAPMGLGLMRRGRLHLRRPAPIKGAGEVAALARTVLARRQAVRKEE